MIAVAKDLPPIIRPMRQSDIDAVTASKARPTTFRGAPEFS